MIYNWRKVRNGDKCAFLTHVGQKDNHMTPHKIAERAFTDLMNQSQHIERVVEKYNSQETANNRLRVKPQLKLFDGLHFKVVLLEVTMRAHIQSIVEIFLNY